MSKYSSTIITLTAALLSSSVAQDVAELPPRNSRNSRAKKQTRGKEYR